MAKNKIITSQGNVQFINSKGKTISMHPMHCYAVYQDDTVSFLFIYMKEYSGQAFFASQFEDLEVDGETYDSIDALKEAIAEAFAKAGAQARTEIVDELPETGYTNTIYLLPKEHGEGYDEYVYNEEKGWQLIGDTDIEFERYLQKVDFNAYSAATEEKIESISGTVIDVDGKINFLSGAVSTEIASREAADAVISGAVDTLSTNLSNEVQRAQNAEQALQNNINTANARIDAEQIARASADNAISGAVDSVVSDLASEVSRATAKENEIDSKVDGEISAREAADSVISGAVDNVSANLSLEVQRAQNAESALDSKVNALSGESVTSGEVESMIDEAVSGKQDTLVSSQNIKTINNESILGSGNIDIQGGGKAVSGGKNISITTGETADTINCTLNANNGRGYLSFVEGYLCEATATYSHAEGGATHAKGYASHAEGDMSSANGDASHAEGRGTNATNVSEHASGQYNVSNKANTTWGDSGNTLFSVGNGTADNARHNAFEIRQNGDIYLTKDGQDVKLQDQLGSGGSSYTAGDGIDITNDVISVTGKADTSAVTEVSDALTAHTADTTVHTTAAEKTSWNGAVTNASNAVTALGGLSLVKLTSAEYESLTNKDSNTLYIISD